MEQFNSKISVPKENVKKTHKESRQPLNTLIDLVPNLVHSSNTRFPTVSGSENSHEDLKIHNKTTDDVDNVAIRREATSSALPRVSSDSTDICNYERDIMKYLLEKEETKPFLLFCTSKKYRAHALNLVTELYKIKGDPAVIQTAAWYFDMLISQQRVTQCNLLLVITACFWIAQKIHGNAYMAPKLIELTGNHFNTAQLFSMERKILCRLKFPPQPVVPQEFLGYLVSCCDSEQSKGTIFSCATFICVTSNNVNIDTCCVYPSVIAVAAVKTTLLLLKKYDLAQKLKECFLYSAAFSKGEVIEVSISQIHALKTFFAEDFKFTASKIFLKDYCYLLDDLKREINFLSSAGRESTIRAFLMK